jgi:hypothetical protein
MKAPNNYAICLGDIADTLRTTARRHLKGYTADEDSFEGLDQPIRRRMEDIYHAYFKPIESRLLGVTLGNHHWAFQDGTNDNQYLCQLAKTKYLGNVAGIRLRIQVKLGSQIRTLRTFKVLCNHGDWSGGYSRIGGDYNAMENRGTLGFSPFDFFFFSHTHRKGGFVVPHMDLSDHGELKLVERPKVFARSGCFMSGYPPKPCKSGYAEKKLLPPTELGHTQVQIHFYRDHDPERYQAMRLKRPDTNYGTPSNWKYRIKLYF